MTIFMGAYARFPLALAAGLGVNALVAYTIAPKMTWADAMGLVVIEGVIITVVVLTGLRQMVFNSVPTPLKTATGVGIGLFLTLIGFVDAGFVRGGTAAPPLNMGIGGVLLGWPTLVFALGLTAMLVLVVLRVRGAILIGIVGATVLAIVIEAIAHVGPQSPQHPKGWSLNVPKLPSKVVDLPELGLLGHLKVIGSWQQVGIMGTLIFVVALLMSDFF